MDEPLALADILSQLTAISDGMFAGTVTFKTSNLNAAMKIHPATQFYNLFEPMNDILYDGDEEDEIPLEPLRSIYEDLEAYGKEVNLKALNKPLKDFKKLLDALDRGERVVRWE